MNSLSIGATGMLAQQLNVEVISNNIANMTTTGYKRQRAEFQDLLYMNIRRPGANSSDSGTVIPSGIQMGAGVKTGGVYRVNEQGNMEITDNELDLAVNGEGYFEIELPTGETGYTRSGSFQLNDAGEMVTAEGFRVIGPGAIPSNTLDITINAEGTVFAKVDEQTAPVEVGQVNIAIFANPAGLEAIGSNLFLETPSSGAAQEGAPGDTGFGALIQGALEQSNVNVVSEITNLITAQRAYEMNSKVISTSDEMLGTINQLR